MSEALLALFALLISMIVIASVLAATLSGSTINPDTQSLVMGWIVGLVITTAFVAVRWRRSAAMLAALKLGTARYPLFLALLLGVAGAFSADLIAALGSGSFAPAAPLLGLNIGDPFHLVIAIVFAVVMQPLAEGLVFFGVLLPRLRSSLGGYGGLLMSAVLFTVYYALVFGARLTESSSLWYGVIFPAIVGLVVAAVRSHADSTRAAIVSLIGAGLTTIAVMIAIA
jgi:membrane protease YdiL (CAAX protease family)